MEHPSVQTNSVVLDQVGMTSQFVFELHLGKKNAGYLSEIQIQAKNIYIRTVRP